MIEGKKYYSEKTTNYIVVMITFSVMVIYSFIFVLDYSNLSIPFLILTLFFLILDVLTMFVFIQTKRKIIYVFYKDDILYLNNIFDKRDNVSVFNQYDVQKKHGKINHILIKDDTGKNKMLLGSNWGSVLDTVESLLIQKQK